MRRGLVAALAIVALLLPAAAAGAPARHVYVRDGASIRWLVAPRFLHVFEGEGSSSFAEALRWHAWGHPAATARGRIAICFKRCNGYMQYRRFPVRLTAFRLGMCHQRFAYRALVLTWRTSAHGRAKHAVLHSC